MNKLALAIALAGLGSAQAELFISEYLEGLGNNKALELFNPTDQSIDLAPYRLLIYFNGNPNSTGSINFQGQIAAGQTFVYASANADPVLVAKAQQTSGQSLWNGDDALVLMRGDQVVDSIGQVGFRPAGQWGNSELGTKDNTLRRIAVLYDTNPNDPFDPSQQWLAAGGENFDDFGRFGPQLVEPEPEPELACGQPFTLIHQVQGATDISPLVDEQVTVEAVVTHVLPGLRGFTMQGEQHEWDQDPMTSEGVFVFAGNRNLAALQSGQRIRLSAQVQERFGQTQLALQDDWLDCGAAELPPISYIELPVADLAVWEAHEGMLVSFVEPLTVNDNFNLARFGELILSSGRRFIPTQLFPPGDQAQALAELHERNRILLDDGSTAQNPALVPYPAPELTASNTLRVGDQVLPFVATLHYGFDEYRLHPVTEPQFVATNPRPERPELQGEGNLKIASFNVLNYFNGDGQGGGFPTVRGARTAEEFARQRAKTLSALVGLDADIIGLMEMENDGFDDHSALADLTRGLIQATDQPWAFASAPVAQVGSDQITQAILYRSDRVRPSAPLVWLDSSNSPLDDQGLPLFNDQRNRPALTQRFELLDNGAELVVVVNHLKSKGSSCAADGDPDLGDGQANCNLTRTRAAQAMAQWLASYQEVPVWILGDLNSYAQEDPIRTLAAAGYHSAHAQLGKENAYSYVFRGMSGQLDHALGNDLALAALVDVTDWHINADEPRALEYTRSFKNARQQELWYAPNAFRSSDHDPGLLLLNLPAKVHELPALLTINGDLITEDGAWVQANYCLYCQAADLGGDSPWLWFAPQQQPGLAVAGDQLNLGWQPSAQHLGGALAQQFYSQVQPLVAKPWQQWLAHYGLSGAWQQQMVKVETLAELQQALTEQQPWILWQGDLTLNQWLAWPPASNSRLLVDGALSVEWTTSLPQPQLWFVTGDLNWRNLQALDALLFVGGNARVQGALVTRPRPD